MSAPSSPMQQDRVEYVRAKGAQYILGIADSTLNPLLRFKKEAAIVFLLVFAFFAFNAVRRGYTYSATSSVVLNPPAFQEEGPASKLIPEPLDVPSYARLMMEDAIIADSLAKATTTNPELWQRMKDNGSLVPQVVRNWFGVRTEVAQKTPQSVLYSKIITLSVRAPKPEMAKELLDAWVETVTAAVQEITVPGSNLTVEYIRGEFSKAKQELETREAALREEQSTHNVTRMKMLKDERERQLTVLTNQLDLALADLELARGRAAALQYQLGTETKTIELHRIASVDSLTIADALGKSSKDPARYLDEQVNAAWITIRSEAAKAEAEAKGLEAKAAQLQEQITALDENLKVLNEEYVTNELKQKQLQREITATETYFTSLAELRESATALEASAQMERAGVITMATPAVLPTEPDNFIMRWGALPVGAITALIAAIAVANLMFEIQRYGQRKEAKATSSGSV